MRFPASCCVFLILLTAAIAHPLDPLTKDEITAALGILRSQHPLSPGTSFPLIALEEPAKSDVIANRKTSRKVRFVIYERPRNETYEAIVDLDSHQVAAWNHIPGVEPPIMPEDFARCDRIVRNSAAWRAGLKKRGIEDASRVRIDVWSIGAEGASGPDKHRLVRTVSYYKGDENTGDFHPVNGLSAVVDLTDGTIVSLTDTDPLPLSAPPVLEDIKTEELKPLDTNQPKGVSFRLSGSEVEWDNWRFHFALHPREGLQIYDVGFLDGGKVRPILYKAGLSEMIVPYGDSSPAWYFRNSFDISGYSFVGRSVVPLERGRDVPANAVFADAVFADERGNSYTSPHAAAIYERDGGILWRYSDVSRGGIVSRRARELVVATIISAPPYEYGFNWVFHQDGRIGMEVLLTGIMATKGVPPDADHGHAQGHRVAPDLDAVHHQHFFNFRLDLDVDGVKNSVMEVNTGAAHDNSADNHGNAIETIETQLTNEQDAKRQVNAASNRYWKVINPSRRNALGEPVGYLLIPGESSPSYAEPSSPIKQRAGFLEAPLWVTRYDPDQRYAAGDYVNQSNGADGLPHWTSAHRKIADEDIVLWYTVGITHIPRPEEWPVMSAHGAGFELVPSGFFRSNPAVSASDIR